MAERERNGDAVAAVDDVVAIRGPPHGDRRERDSRSMSERDPLPASPHHLRGRTKAGVEVMLGSTLPTIAFNGMTSPRGAPCGRRPYRRASAGRAARPRPAVSQPRARARRWGGARAQSRRGRRWRGLRSC